MKDISARFVARVPLFDRLGGVDSERDVLPNEEPYRALTLRGVHESVYRELQRLLEARSSLLLIDLLLRTNGDRSVVDYGLPDFCWIVASDMVTRDRLVDAIARTIGAFEPRLQQVRVKIEESVSTRGRLSVTVAGTLVLGHYREPVSFPALTLVDPVREANR